jgi:hypothetical protein
LNANAKETVTIENPKINLGIKSASHFVCRLTSLCRINTRGTERCYLVPKPAGAARTVRFENSFFEDSLNVGHRKITTLFKQRRHQVDTNHNKDLFDTNHHITTVPNCIGYWFVAVRCSGSPALWCTGQSAGDFALSSCMMSTLDRDMKQRSSDLYKAQSNRLYVSTAIL